MTFYIPETVVLNGGGGGAAHVAATLHAPTLGIISNPTVHHIMIPSQLTILNPIYVLTYDSPSSLASSMMLETPYVDIYEVRYTTATAGSPITTSTWDTSGKWETAADANDNGDAFFIASWEPGEFGPDSYKIHRTIDRGVTWFVTEPAAWMQGYKWTDIQCSANGQYVIANFIVDSSVYVSTNYGASYSQKNVPYQQYHTNYSGAAINADGSFMVVLQDSNGGDMYTSTNGGNTWVANQYPRVWTSLADPHLASNATTWLLGESNGSPYPKLWFTDDAGANFRDCAPGVPLNYYWSGTDVSSDGMHMIATSSNSGHVIVSHDSGYNWTEILPFYSGWATDPRISDDGQVLAWSRNYGPANGCYASFDGGVTHEELTKPGGISFAPYQGQLAMSTDGSAIYLTDVTAAASGGLVYINQ